MDQPLLTPRAQDFGSGPELTGSEPFDCASCIVKNKFPVMLIGIVLIIFFATLCIVVWFGSDLGAQVAGFVLSFIGLVLAIISVALPVRCEPCSCGK